MGCDIHLVFEHKVAGKWEPLFPMVASSFWWESIIDDKLHDGSIQTIFGEPNEDEAYKKAEEYYSSLDRNKCHSLIERYGMIHVEQNYPEDNSDFISGEYRWSSFLAAGVRGAHEHAFPQRGKPTDCSPEVKSFIEAYGGDGHSHSWLMVDELLKRIDRNQVDVGADIPIKWLRKHISNPANTRMVFYFDN